MKKLEFAPGTIKIVDGVQYVFQEVYEFRDTGHYDWDSENDPVVNVVHVENKFVPKVKPEPDVGGLKEAAYRIIDRYQVWTHTLQQVKKGVTRLLSGVSGELALENVIEEIRKDVGLLAQAVLRV